VVTCKESFAILEELFQAVAIYEIKRYWKSNAVIGCSNFASSIFSNMFDFNFISD